MQSIVDDMLIDPAIDAGAFPDTHSSRYWSTTYTNFSDYAWYVYFGGGHVHYDYKSSTNYVRCVR